MHQSLSALAHSMGHSFCGGRNWVFINGGNMGYHKYRFFAFRIGGRTIGLSRFPGIAPITVSRKAWHSLANYTFA